MQRNVRHSSRVDTVAVHLHSDMLADSVAMTSIDYSSSTHAALRMNDHLVIELIAVFALWGVSLRNVSPSAYNVRMALPAGLPETHTEHVSLII